MTDATTPEDPMPEDPMPEDPLPEDPTAAWNDVVHLDAAQLKVLAHPLRSRLLGALRLEGPATATALAARLGTNSGATSYHLRQLAEVGLVVEDHELGDGRSRVWRSEHRGSRFRDLDFRDDPDERAAAEWLIRSQVRTHARWADAWLDEREQWPESWRRGTDLSDWRLELTPEQMVAMVAELHEVIARYRELNPPGTPGTEHVRVQDAVFPYRDAPL